MRLAVLLLVVVALAGCAGGSGTTPAEVAPTLEATTTFAPAPEQDSEDVDGPLDLRWLEVVRIGDLLTVGVTMWGPWDPELLAGPSALAPGPNELTILYDVDLDGRADYEGSFLATESAPVLAISGEGEAFEPVPILNRPSPETIEVTHPLDVLFVVLGEQEIESAVEIQVAARSVFEGAEDRLPDEGWILVPSGGL